MLALNKSDIQDIADGNHNRYVESQDKDELLRELANRLLQATPDVSEIDDKLTDISECLDDIEEKLSEANKYINEAQDVLLTITE